MTASRRRQRIIKLLREWGAMSTTQLADDIDERVGAVYTNCRELTQAGAIERAGLVGQGPNRGGVQMVTLWRVV